MPPESETPGNEPNLELPSLGLGFGRKKKRGKTAEVATSHAGDAGSPEQDAAPADGEVTPTAPDASADAPTGPATAPARPAAPRAPAAPPAPARAPGAGPTPPRPAARPAARPPSRPAAAATPPQATGPASAPKPAPARPPIRPEAEPESTPETVTQAPVPVSPPPVAPAPAPEAAKPEPTAEPVAPTEPEPTAPDVEQTTVLEPAVPGPTIEPTPDPLTAAAAALDEPTKRRSRRDKPSAKPRDRSRRSRPAKVKRERPAPAEALVATLPPISPILASLVTGVLSGLAAVALAVGASRGCEAVRDTSSCGGGLGLLALVAILAIEVVIGASLLKAWKIPDPFSTSFLGVGIVATVAMLTFLDSLDSVWMFLVIPVITGATFVLSWWTTVRFIGEYDPDARRVESDETDLVE